MRASESSHYYDKSGNPVYEVPNASKPGEFRPTTLKDARKLDLVPSYSTVSAVMAKPQLEKWKIKQAILASLTLPKPKEISEDDWIDAIIDDASRQSKDSMELGTRIHAAIQGAYEGELWEPEFEPHCYATIEAIQKEFGNLKWIAEKPFAELELEYGGKVDLHSECGTVVIDFKTTSLSGEDLKKAGYPEHVMQLAAYRKGLKFDKAALCNVYISTTAPGQVYLRIWKEEEADHALRKWIALLNFWKIDKKF